MSYKMAGRTQMTTLPPIIDDYVSGEDPVRAYDAFVDALDFQALGISLIPSKGQDEYYPKAMMRLLVYGYAYGIRSSRQLERACRHNLAFIWLMGNLQPDYRTIARFRHDHKEALTKVLKQCVRMCIKLNLVDGNTLFIDGSKFRANASIKQTWTQRRAQETLAQIDTRIEQILQECERADQSEEKRESLVTLNKELADEDTRRKKIHEIVKDLEQKQNDYEQTPGAANQRGEVTYNETDPDCARVSGRQGTHAGYNVQMAVDKKHGLIVQAESTNSGCDYNQLSRQVDQSVETLEKKPQDVCADAGYSTIQDLKLVDKDIRLVVPSRQQAQEDKGQKLPEFSKEQFRYDEGTNAYICPRGQTLKYIQTDEERRTDIYQAAPRACQACSHWGACTKSQNGRRVSRSHEEPFREQLKTIYNSSDGQAIYKLRKEKVELPFGHLKRNLSAGQFLLRGLLGTTAEINILSSCFNMARMITIFGVAELINKLRTMT